VTKLILFDIDGTLVLTGGAGGRAMARAFEDVFGLQHGMASISMAGRTDAWIVAQMAANHGLACTPELFARFHETYIGHLQQEIHKPGPQKGVLPGVREVLEVLADHSAAHLALLTGNFERGAQIKLEYFDLWRYFGSGAFGDHTHDRNSLLGTALARVANAGGPAVKPSEIVVVGDTPLDVAVAVAGGARSLAVATGSYDVDAVLAGLGLASGPG
jgi:phosphoglycolate phosphatase